MTSSLLKDIRPLRLIHTLFNRAAQIGTLALFSFALVCPQVIATFPELSITTSTEARKFVDDTLKAMGKLPEGSKPVVLFLHPRGQSWGRLQQELAVALSRYGLAVEGVEVDFENLSPTQEQSLLELDKPHGIHTAIWVEDKGGRWEKAKSWAASTMGLQHSFDHFRKLYRYIRERRTLRKDFKNSDEGPPDSFEVRLKEFQKSGEYYPYFRWVKDLPHGFGGTLWDQPRYLAIASVNTFSFSLLNQGHRGLPEALLWGFTYLYNMGADYMNYLRTAGRMPSWYVDSKTGLSKMTSDVQQTFSRRFFFVVTWTVIAGCNILVVTPIAIAQGSDKILPWTYAVLSNATLGVFSFAFIDAFFSRLRRKDRILKLEADEIKKRLEIQDLSKEEIEQLEAEEENLRKRAKRFGLSEKWLRFGYYGGVYPFFKHDHLLGNAWKQYILVGMGTIGFVIDMIENRIRLNAFGGKPHVVESVTASYQPSSTFSSTSCATHLIVTSREKTDAFLQTLSR